MGEESNSAADIGEIAGSAAEDLGEGMEFAVAYDVGESAGKAVEDPDAEEVRREEAEIDDNTERKGRRSTLMANKKRSVHVTPRGNKWAIVREGSERASSLHDTQKQAEKKGRETARRDKVEFYLHNQQGQIRDRDSYGPDSSSSRG